MKNQGTARQVSLVAATSIVVADIIGTGIFTSLGFQVGDLPSGFVILCLWALGGLCAMCGALCYAELGAAMPRSGGEYHFLGKIYHPAIGFVAGWISATAGFSAPVALAAMAFGRYLTGVFPQVSPLVASLLVVWVSTPFLLGTPKLGSIFQIGSTLLKIVLILIVIVAGCLAGNAQSISFLPKAGDGELIASAPFAISLVYVMFAYAGWNASIYIAGEMKNPSRAIPLSVGIGTAIVTVLYLGVNSVFLISTPMQEIAGKVEVALVAAPHLFGTSGGQIMAAMLCLSLISTVSAMMWIGPRVMMVMGEDLPGLRWLAARSTNGIPVRATLVQFALVNFLLLVTSFEQVLTGAQVLLQLCSFLAVLGVVILRFSQPGLPRPYRTWGYPLTPFIFLAVSGWMLWHTIVSRPVESAAGLAVAVAGLLLYLISHRKCPASR
ncbi:MAG: APC family permease [Spartobacteria bacterium]